MTSSGSSRLRGSLASISANTAVVTAMTDTR
jgi:hypothetical protein